MRRERWHRCISIIAIIIEGVAVLCVHLFIAFLFKLYFTIQIGAITNLAFFSDTSYQTNAALMLTMKGASFSLCENKFIF